MSSEVGIGTRVGVVTYSDAVNNPILLNSYFNKQHLFDAIDKLKYLEVCYFTILNTQSGDIIL